MANGNGGRRYDASFPYDAKRVPALGGDSTQPSDSRAGTPEVDRECLPRIPVTPSFDDPSAALRKGGSKKRGETESYAEERSEGEA